MSVCTLSLQSQFNSLFLDDTKTDFCKVAFNKHPSADCILYDDEECDGEEGVKEMRRGSVLFDVETELDFDVESVSIRAGCLLTVYTGSKICVLLQFIFYNFKNANTY